MGTAALSVTNFARASVQMNWKPPAIASPTFKVQNAKWTEGNGIQSNGFVQAAEMFVGAPVTLVPEPTSFTLLLCGSALITLRRRKVR